MNPVTPFPVGTLASSAIALQHRPRPLALFLHMLRSTAGDDPARMAAVLAGVRAYQQAPRPALLPPAPVVATAGRARLLDHGGAGPPLIVVPSLINGAEILDLDGERSLVRWLAGRGVRPLLVDWGVPDAAERGRSMAGHVEELLLPLIDGLGERPLLAGYCLGGTMALAAAALRPVRALALIAAPWRFGGYGGDAQQLFGRLWEEARPAAERLGLLPMDVLQAAFWQLDIARTLDKFAAFGRVAADPEAVAKFVAMEDWSNGGAPLTLAAARELVEDMFDADLPGTGRWIVGGTTSDPARLQCPVLEIVSTNDRIVPAASAVGVGERLSLGLGHVGMVVGGRRRELLWAPLARWLTGINRR